MSFDLPEREAEILSSVVDLYVRVGAPVSSFKIKEVTDLPTSTATIRNVLAKLEKRGLLKKPYTSAGRVPTDEGYRFIIDGLEPDNKLCHEFSALFREEIKEEREIEVIMSAASKLLGNLSRNFAVVYGSIIQDSRINKLNLIELEGNRMLVVVHLYPEFERTAVIRIEGRFSRDVMIRAEGLINPIVQGKSLVEAREALDNAVRDNITEEGIIMSEVAIHRESIFSQPPAVELYFEDREHIFEQQELSDPSLLQMLLRLLHNKDYLISILSRRLEERTMVTVGAENKDKVLEPFSLVTSSYRMGGARGVLGILGPTRMRYDVALFLVGTIAKELSAIGEEYY